MSTYNCFNPTRRHLGASRSFLVIRGTPAHSADRFNPPPRSCAMRPTLINPFPAEHTHTHTQSSCAPESDYIPICTLNTNGKTFWCPFGLNSSKVNKNNWQNPGSINQLKVLHFAIGGKHRGRTAPLLAVVYHTIHRQPTED